MFKNVIKKYFSESSSGGSPTSLGLEQHAALLSSLGAHSSRSNSPADSDGSAVSSMDGSLNELMVSTNKKDPQNRN